MSEDTTLNILLNRRSIRAFLPDAIDEETMFALEDAAQHAASSQYLNDWSAIRITDPELKQKLAEIGNQPYIASAPLLYVFVLDEYRNAMIAQQGGVDIHSDTFTLNNSYRFSQAQNDAVLALHAMETAAESLGLGCVILGSLLNNVPELISLLGLPQFTYPVLGLALGKPAQEPALKPRLPRNMQFFDNQYDTNTDHFHIYLQQFDDEVHHYYDLRNPDRPVDTFSSQITSKAVEQGVLDRGIAQAEAQGFDLER